MAKRRRKRSSLASLFNVLGAILLIIAGVMDLLVLITALPNMAVLTSKLISTLAFFVIGIYVLSAEGAIARRRNITLDTSDPVVMLVLAIIVLIVYVMFSGNIISALGAILFILSAVVLFL